MHALLPHAAEDSPGIHLRWGERSLTARTGALPETATRAWFCEALSACARGEPRTLDLGFGGRLSLHAGGPGGLWLHLEGPPGTTAPTSGVPVAWGATWRAWLGTSPPEAPAQFGVSSPPSPIRAAGAQPPNPRSSGVAEAEAELRFEAHALGVRVHRAGAAVVVEAELRTVLAGFLTICRPFIEGLGSPSAGPPPWAEVAEGRPERWSTARTAGGWSLSLIGGEGQALGPDFEGDLARWRGLLRGCGVLQLGDACMRFEVRRWLSRRLARLRVRPRPERGSATAARPATRTLCFARHGVCAPNPAHLHFVRWRLRWSRAPRGATEVRRWGRAVVVGGFNFAMRLDAESGKILWQQRGMRLTALPELGATARGRLVRIHRHSGERIWSAPVDARALRRRCGAWLWIQGIDGLPQALHLGTGRTWDPPPMPVEDPDRGLAQGGRWWTWREGTWLGQRPERVQAQLRWPAPGPPSGEILSVHRHFIYPVGDGPQRVLVGLDLRSGQVWAHPHAGFDPILTCAIDDPNLGPVLLWLGGQSPSRWLTAIEVRTGHARWQIDLGPPVQAERVGAASEVEVGPASNHLVGHCDGILIQGPAGDLVACARSTGEVLWRSAPPPGQPPPRRPPPLHWQGVWLVSQETVVALRATDGRPVGRLETEGLIPDHLSALPDGGLLVAEAGEARVYDLAGHLALAPGLAHAPGPEGRGSTPRRMGAPAPPTARKPS